MSNLLSMKTDKSKPIYVVDLFCGAGGLTRGLLDSGLNVVAGYDIDGFCKHSFETNNSPAKFIEKSICQISKKDIKSHYPSKGWNVLVGCAPCQPFSTYTQGKTDPEDHRWSLLREFMRLVTESKPAIVSMENVVGLQKHIVFAEFIARLSSLGYHVNVSRVFCPDYGIPQNRTRLVVLASRLGEIELQKPTCNSDSFMTVRKSIGKLARLSAGEADLTDPLHRCSRLSRLNRKRMALSTPGGTWRDWPKKLIARCHNEESGLTYGSVYGRMKWDEPSPTITTQFFGFGNGRFGHPEQDRALSLREGAILQTFPANYEFLGPDSEFSMRRLGGLIGNAVPVKLGQVIGSTIKEHLIAHES